MTTEERNALISSQIGAFVRNLFAGIISVAGGSLVIWAIIEPQITEYIKGIVRNEQIEPFEKMSEKFETLNNELAVQREIISSSRDKINSIGDVVGVSVPVVRFEGGGHFVYEGPYKTGTTTPLEYYVHRTNTCRTIVTEQFYSADLGRILTRFTREFPASQAPASFGPQPFIIDMRIPRDMPPGRYARRGKLSFDKSQCPGQPDVIIPSSGFFTVEASNASSD